MWATCGLSTGIKIIINLGIELYGGAEPLEMCVTENSRGFECCSVGEEKAWL